MSTIDHTVEQALHRLENDLRNIQRSIEKRYFLHVPECATLTAIDFQQHLGIWDHPIPYQVGHVMIKLPYGPNLEIGDAGNCIGLRLRDEKEIDFIFDDKAPLTMALIYYLGKALEVHYKVKGQTNMLTASFQSAGERPAQAFINDSDYNPIEQITIVTDSEKPWYNTVLLAFCAE